MTTRTTKKHTQQAIDRIQAAQAQTKNKRTEETRSKNSKQTTRSSKPQTRQRQRQTQRWNPYSRIIQTDQHGIGINRFRNHYQTMFEDVVVRPTNLQIESAVEDFAYTIVDISENNYTQCPITMETFEPEQMISRIRHCGHVFSHAGLRNWFMQNVRCPVCRYDIRESPIQYSVLQRPTDVSGLQQHVQSPSSILSPSSIPSLFTPSRPITEEQMQYLEHELNQLYNDETISETLIREPIREPTLREPTLREPIIEPIRREPTIEPIRREPVMERFPTWQNFSNTLRNFIQEELQNNPNIAELIYTFDVPISMADISGSRIG